MPYQLFQPLGETEKQVVTQNIKLLSDLIDLSQEQDWIDFFTGEEPSKKLKWKGSLQEAYFLFNEIRIATLAGKSLIQIQTKNRGLDWVKINKAMTTKFGKVQKESRPQDAKAISKNLMLFLSALDVVQ